MNKIEINQDFSKALNVLLNTKENIFITGKAGTGKTTFLKLATEELKKKNKKLLLGLLIFLSMILVGLASYFVYQIIDSKKEKPKDAGSLRSRLSRQKAGR